MKIKFGLTVSLLWLVGSSYGCKCTGPGTVKSSFSSSDIIISGQVLTKELVSYAQTVNPDSVSAVRERLKDDKQKVEFFDMSYIFKIELVLSERYKGTTLRDTVTIYTAMNSASCGYDFEIGKTYIVYASKRSSLDIAFLNKVDINRGMERKNTYWTTHCTRTTEYNSSEAEELRLLSKN